MEEKEKKLKIGRLAFYPKVFDSHPGWHFPSQSQNYSLYLCRESSPQETSKDKLCQRSFSRIRISCKSREQRFQVPFAWTLRVPKQSSSFGWRLRGRQIGRTFEARHSPLVYHHRIHNEPKYSQKTQHERRSNWYFSPFWWKRKKHKFYLLNLSKRTLVYLYEHRNGLIFPSWPQIFNERSDNGRRKRRVRGRISSIKT